jgi:23S rRNA (guanosine2251-2'-O)-methyltransferase
VKDFKHGHRGPHQRGAKTQFPPSRLLMGRNSLHELIRFDPQRIEKVFTSAGEGSNDRSDELRSELTRNRIPVEQKSAHELAALAGSDAHQSFVALLRERPPVELKALLRELEPKEQSIVLMLDDVQDPQNLGAILRSSECFGADAVIWSKNRGAPLTPAARKASVGASELVTTVEVSNLVDAIRKIKEHGFWTVGADVSPDAQSAFSFEFPKKMVLILGAEEQGMHALVKKELDFRVYIPMSGRIDSLNVAQATAVLLALYVRA